ncbi:uncharacterized protein LOC127078870 [Lathyrus oleraceus]|uniref:uncharacterized protein LOC127078870 n=1 Tax=Pisum sativum TaxID=3888 RepID=UPI0021CFBC3D|nr:uncharacterized protein LOC127078870 [Pisum sativum]
MACIDAHKVLYGIHMLSEEAEYWWDNVLNRLKANGTKITWIAFRAAFMEKYFPTDVSSKKEIELLELKQGNTIVVDYVAKFEELFSHARSSGYKSVSDKKSGIHNRIKMYVVPDECKSTVVVCFNCSEVGHISTECQKCKKTQDVKAGGKVFALSGANTSKFDNLIRATCFINGIPLITIINTNVMHSLISVDCVKRLNLVVSTMNGSMVIDTQANGLVAIYFVCLNFPLTILSRHEKYSVTTQFYLFQRKWKIAIKP